MDTLRKDQKKILEIKSTEIKNAFDGSSLDQKQVRNEAMTLKTCQQTLPKMKGKEKKKKIPQDSWTITIDIMYVCIMGIPE